MMDMGFWPDVRRIIAALPATRQTLLFSATIPDEVVRSALEIVKEPKFVQVGQRSAPALRVATIKTRVIPDSAATIHIRRQSEQRKILAIHIVL